ncbi:MAG: TolC family protein [Proteobacteria bacterium]|nr:TolC family protein [Pseudomonadota bacterium]MCP4919796.1 TolC family protein [Pseudomonadota bacterium]
MMLFTFLLGFTGRTEVVVPVQEFSETTAGTASPSWWTDFGDATLSSLVDQALEQNLDLVAGDHRVRSANARSWQAAGPALPYANLTASRALTPCETAQFNLCEPIALVEGEDTPDAYTVQSWALNAGVNVDVFGATTNSALATRLEAQAAEGDVAALELVVSTRVASTWFLVTSAREQLAITQEQVALQEDLLAISELQLERGLATGLDVLQQRQAVAQVNAGLPSAEAGVRNAELALALLLNDDVVAADFPAGGLPELPPTPPTGTPEDLLTRPDVAASVKRLEAARRREKSAARSALPTLGLSASTGEQTTFILDEETTTETWSLAAGVTVPILNGGLHATNTMASRAETDAARASAQQALLTAIQEVETALANEDALVDQVAASALLLDAAELAYTQAVERYSAGDVPYIQVAAAANSLYAARLSDLSARRAQLDARLALHSALGR